MTMNMTQDEIRRAADFIDERRKENGGLTREDREKLSREMPHILDHIANLRRRLGASTRT